MSTTEVEVTVSKLLNGLGVVAYGVQVSNILTSSFLIPRNIIKVLFFSFADPNLFLSETIG